MCQYNTMINGHNAHTIFVKKKYNHDKMVIRYLFFMLKECTINIAIIKWSTHAILYQITLRKVTNRVNIIRSDHILIVSIRNSKGKTTESRYCFCGVTGCQRSGIRMCIALGGKSYIGDSHSNHSHDYKSSYS